MKEKTLTVSTVGKPKMESLNESEQRMMLLLWLKSMLQVYQESRASEKR